MPIAQKAILPGWVKNLKDKKYPFLCDACGKEPTIYGTCDGRFLEACSEECMIILEISGSKNDWSRIR